MIQTSVNLACPKKGGGTRPAVPWWNPELSEMRKRVNKLHAKRKKNLVSKAEHSLAVDEYKTAIVRAKEESWRVFCSEANKGEETRALLGRSREKAALTERL
jgi:hypothetical protein